MNTWGYSFYYKPQKESTLEELKERVIKITDTTQHINDSELSEETIALAIKELREKKAELIALMHQMVDKL